MQKYSLKAGFAALFLFQLLFNYWTMHPGITAQQLPIILQDFFTYRLNYLPLHYLFIFMLGGLAAVKEKEFFKTLTGNFKSVSALYLLSIIYICGSYYYYYYQHGYDLISLTNTFQQLSPQGFILSLIHI